MSRVARLQKSRLAVERSSTFFVGTTTFENTSNSGRPLNGFSNTHRSRSGFSLLEVILAMVLLASAAAVLFQLAYVGRRHLQDADRQLQAQLLCQNRLREILCGIEPLESCDSTPFDASPGWNVTVELESVDSHEGVQLLKVTVAEETDSLLDDPDAAGTCSFMLSQWVLDPNANDKNEDGSDEGNREEQANREQPPMPSDSEESDEPDPPEEEEEES